MAGGKRKSSPARNTRGPSEDRHVRRRLSPSPISRPRPRLHPPSPVEARSRYLPILPRQDGSGPAVAEPVKVPAPAEEAREVVAAGREGADRMNDKGESSEDTGSNGERGSDDESESEFEGFDDMFSGDIALPNKTATAEDLKSENERARLKAIEVIRKLTGLEPETAIRPRHQPPDAPRYGYKSPSSREVCPWGKKYLEKLAEIFVYATPKELNDWLSATVDNRMKHRTASQVASSMHASMLDLNIYCAICKKEHREGKRSMKRIED